MANEVSSSASFTDANPKYAWTRKDSRDKIKRTKRKQSGHHTPIVQIHLLPAELWLDIFSRLDYTTINSSVRYVCRDFRSLLSRRSTTSSAPIDVALFRDFPTMQTVKQEYTLHPILAQLVPAHSTSMDFVYSLHTTKEGKAEIHAKARNFRNFYNCRMQLPNKMFSIENIFLLFLSPVGREKTVWRENATSPAVSFLSIKPETYPFNTPHKDITFTSTSGGITVFDIMIASVVSLYHDFNLRAMTRGHRVEIPLKKDDVQKAVSWIVGRHMHEMPKRVSMFEPWVYVNKWVDETGIMGKMGGN